MACQGLGERGADRPPGGPHHEGGDDDEPGVVIDPADEFQFPPVGQQHSAHDVELPQLHRFLAFPPLIRGPWPVAPARDDEIVAGQDPRQRRLRRNRLHSTALQLVLQTGRTPPRVGTA